jgi:hypothetical protein
MKPTKPEKPFAHCHVCFAPCGDDICFCSDRPTSPDDVLGRARDLLFERSKQYDDQTMPNAASLFFHLTGIYLSTRDGHIFLACLKLTRIYGKGVPHHTKLDSYLDAINYLALACATELNEKKD